MYVCNTKKKFQNPNDYAHNTKSYLSQCLVCKYYNPNSHHKSYPNLASLAWHITNEHSSGEKNKVVKKAREIMAETSCMLYGFINGK